MLLFSDKQLAGEFEQKPQKFVFKTLKWYTYNCFYAIYKHLLIVMVLLRNYLLFDFNMKQNSYQ